VVRVYLALMTSAALLLSPALHAATYHVAQRANGADDANPGTLRRPWKTLAQATRHLKPGDTLILHSGLYREKITLPVSGTPAAPITLRAADGEQPVITGADETRLWTRVSGEEPIYRTPWARVFAIDEKDGQPVRAHGASAPVGRAEQAFCWGKPLRMVLRRQQMAPDTFFIDDDEKALYAWFPEDPARGGAELSTRDLLLEGSPAARRGIHHIHLRGLTFRRAANFAQRGAVRIDGSHWRIEDCVFEGMNGPGASITGTDHLLRRCTFRDNGQLGFGASRAHRLRLEACRLLHNNTKGFSSGWEAGGCKIVLTRGSVIDRCVALDNAGPGFWYDIGNEQSLVRSCYAARNEVGLMYEISYGLTARNNLMLNNGDPRGPAWGTGGIMVSSSPGCVLENNVCAGNRAGIAFREQARTTPRIDASSGAAEVEVFCAHEIVQRNILAGNWEHQLAFWFDTRFFGPHPSGADTSAPLGRDPGRQGYTLAGNLFYAAPGQGLILYGARWRAKATLHASLASFSRTSGIPASGRIAEPRFRDPLAGDFRVTPQSPALPLKAGLAKPDVVPKGAG
jgi:parallel beta-helix repeat protein